MIFEEIIFPVDSMAGYDSRPAIGGMPADVIRERPEVPGADR